MHSPANQLTPLKEGVPFPFDHLDSESMSEAIMMRSKSRNCAAAAVELVELGPRLTKKARKGKKSEHCTQKEMLGSRDDSQMQTQRMTTPAEKRRLNLESDPDASMIDIYNVQCIKCGAKIKLSAKGLSDLHHWKRHRKRCDKWSNVYAAKKRAENCTEPSRMSTDPSTPPLTEDFGTEFTQATTRSTSLATTNTQSPAPNAAGNAETKEILAEDTVSLTAAATATDDALSLAPPPPAATVDCGEERRWTRPAQLRFSLSSHTESTAAMALLHPDTEVLDLNTSLLDVPVWSWADIKPSMTVYRCREWGRTSVLLSAADWDE